MPSSAVFNVLLARHLACPLPPCLLLMQHQACLPRFLMLLARHMACLSRPLMLPRRLIRDVLWGVCHVLWCCLHVILRVFRVVLCYWHILWGTCHGICHHVFFLRGYFWIFLFTYVFNTASSAARVICSPIFQWLSRYQKCRYILKSLWWKQVIFT